MTAHDKTWLSIVVSGLLLAAVAAVIVFLERQRRVVRWNAESFLKRACELISGQVDWRTVDSGRLHHTACNAQTLDGTRVVVAVLDDVRLLPVVVNDAARERTDAALPPSTPLWLYVPAGMALAGELPLNVEVKRVD